MLLNPSSQHFLIRNGIRNEAAVAGTLVLNLDL